MQWFGLPTWVLSLAHQLSLSSPDIAISTDREAQVILGTVGLSNFASLGLAQIASSIDQDLLAWLQGLLSTA